MNRVMKHTNLYYDVQPMFDSCIRDTYYGCNVIINTETRTDASARMHTHTHIYVCLCVSVISRMCYFMTGTKKQRGLVGWQTYENDEKDEEKNDTETQTSSIYNLPFLPDFIRNSKLARHVPFLPMYSFNTMFTNCLRKQK